MVNRLPSWIFLCLAILLMGFALTPLVRVALGIDDTIQMSFLTMVSILIGGLMCGLTAMLLLAKRQPELRTYFDDQADHVQAAKMHACGLLLFTGLPLANFLACYYLWVTSRSRSRYLDYQGREAICFQITIYLYLLMCLFMAYVIIGALAIPLLLIFSLLASLTAVASTLRGKQFRYPANISIIDRGMQTVPATESA
ncbi:DUF4870 domain-containing protein [Arenicella xantha]|uniref:Putative Tic20 family protein n=1 Tax=Arenicella xantha TaxID=644221 RepID=A0A395JPM3_9GAMM|nr:DUF4870 domain-containing protein [Arenicella xantha]RBP53600.1 putative Tic20 family protein [Arenicella xantha]